MLAHNNFEGQYTYTTGVVSCGLVKTVYLQGRGQVKTGRVAFLTRAPSSCPDSSFSEWDT